MASLTTMLRWAIFSIKNVEGETVKLQYLLTSYHHNNNEDSFGNLTTASTLLWGGEEGGGEVSKLAVSSKILSLPLPQKQPIGAQKSQERPQN